MEDLLKELQELIEGNYRLQCDLEILELEDIELKTIAQAYDILEVYDKELMDKIVCKIPIYIVIQTVNNVLKSLGRI